MRKGLFPFSFSQPLKNDESGGGALASGTPLSPFPFLRTHGGLLSTSTVIFVTPPLLHL